MIMNHSKLRTAKLFSTDNQYIIFHNIIEVMIQSKWFNFICSSQNEDFFMI